MRIVAAREQAEMLLPWRTASNMAPVHLNLHPDEVLRYQHPGNPWRHMDRLEDLKSSISQQGIRQPIQMLTNGTHAFVDDGHHRALGAQQLGMTQAPVHIDHDPYLLDDTPDAQPLQPGPLKDWIDSHEYTGASEENGAPIWSERKTGFS